jgi:hypothetical protein
MKVQTGNAAPWAMVPARSREAVKSVEVQAVWGQFVVRRLGA